MMRLLVFFMLLPSLAMSSDQLVDAKASLKKWGMAYCLGTYQKDDHSKMDASLAMGGYFQIGSHNDEIAYSNVRNFFDMAMKADQRVSKENGQPIILMRCLDVYESPNYKKIISAQDKFLK